MSLMPYANEPFTDFTRAENADRMSLAVRTVRESWLGKDWPMFIDGQPVTTGTWIERHNPCNTSELVGRAAVGTREHNRDWTITLMCRVLDVSTQGYYAWVQRQKAPPGPRTQRSGELAKKVRTVFEDHDHCYGSPRIFKELRARGVKCNVKTIASIMVREGMQAKHKRRFKPQTTDSNHGHEVAENLLAQDFQAETPDQVWVADTTYVWAEGRWCYLATVLDLFSRRIVGWQLSTRNDSTLVCDALRSAWLLRQPAAGLIVHSDRGVQYASAEHQRLLKAMKAKCSMSRKGNCYDNAVMESFFGSLKRELIWGVRFDTVPKLRSALFKYIEVYYNRVRRHSTLGYVSPAEFESQAA